jgi:hypothetical protein
MTTAITELLGLSSRPISAAPPMLSPSVRRLAGPLADELEAMLTVKNGFFAYATALHVFPACSTADAYSLYEWNEPSLWKGQYGKLLADAICFAEDIFAEPFVIKAGAVWRFSPQTEEFTPMGDSLEVWARLIDEDDAAEAGYGFAADWKAEHGTVPLGRRLAPKIPFVGGGEYAVSNFYACDPVDRLRFTADFARQIRHLPDGTKIELVVVD